MYVPGKSKFSFDTLFVFDFDVRVEIQENFVLNQKVAWFSLHNI